MPTTSMPYRRLGRSGLQVSVLSFGSWVSFGTQLDTGLARDCLAAAGDAGVNFFDNAEAYAGGRVRADHGRRHRRARLAARDLRRVVEVLLGPDAGREHAATR